MRRPLFPRLLAPALPALAAEDGRVGVAAVQTFANDARIEIPGVFSDVTGGPAAPYPSAIEVAGVPVGIADLNVRFPGFSYNHPQKCRHPAGRPARADRHRHVRRRQQRPGSWRTKRYPHPR